MATDLTFENAQGNHKLRLTGKSDVPELLKEAIVLMLFSKDPDIKNFNGGSIVNAFATIPQSGIGGITFYLTVAATKIKQILRTRHPEVSDVYFDTTNGAGQLNVTLNVRTGDDTESAVVW